MRYVWYPFFMIAGLLSVVIAGLMIVLKLIDGFLLGVMEYGEKAEG